MESARPVARRMNRGGFTLTELMISLVMFGVISAVILGLVRGQQRFYRGATEVIDVRSQLRQAAALLPLELRSISTVSTVAPAGSKFKPSILGSDITLMTDSAIEFRTTIGSGVVCANSGATLTLVPAGVLAHGNMLSSWYLTPAVNDTTYVYVPGDSTGSGDDQWRPYRISAIPPTWPKAACVGAGASFLTAGVDDTLPNLQFTLVNLDDSPAVLPSSVKSGSIVRFTRSVRYGLYPASDGQWYLGYRVVSTQPAYDPVSGPYRPYVGGGLTNGLAFTYFDSSGVQLTDMSQRDKVARVDIVLRGAGKEKRNAASWTASKNNDVFQDSLLVRVAIRNRS